MSYVDLKHLLADLALEAARHPAEAAWVAVAAAYAELATVEHPQVGRSDCLERAAILAAQHGWVPHDADVGRLITLGLLENRGGGSIVLPDRFRPHLAYFRRHLPRLLNAVADLSGVETSPDVPGDVRVGAALFNAGLFFECHEWFEGLWKATTGRPKDFYHGIVQAAASFYHYEKSNRHGSRTLLGKGLRRLASYPPQFLGVDLARLEDDLMRWAAHFEGGPRPEEFPRIHLPQPVSAEEAKGAPRG